MLITHPKGLYTIKYDSARRVAYDAPVGLWTKEDYADYHSQYVNKIGPAVGGQTWAVCTDVRKYKISDLGDVIAKHTEWLNENKVQYAAIIVDSAIVKMQMNRAVGGKIPQQAFLNEQEADEWLKSKGF
ncbi:hypothetical protein acsn021_37780 [Anaerocolumna cellulosilytica]|uniref:Uncharacterized protein n=1 Tax=Anaerocolumna cellulosilytica TaxID=433286 RepID=A0A6S6R4D9_9FIRM|nr:hypothetical protein [Anaerocolumna cellulosilytica]MBB5194956.1 hypothetical protein [Anaerocolumna cellulosilytica]BCJ96209.1 hypothetical protein acsn021_37780 [Anaerocolumna cellulosilytica]